VPKGIEVPHHALPHFLKWYAPQFGLRTSDRFAMLSGLSHDPVLRDIFTPLALGATLHIPQQDYLTRPDHLNAWLREQRITVFHATPSLCRLLCAAGARSIPLPDLRYVFIGGETLLYRDLSSLRLLAPHAQAVNCYGATETPQFMAFHTVAPRAAQSPTTQRAVPLGAAIADTQILVITSNGTLAGEGETGEIYVRTPYLSKGYLSDPALTVARFIRNPFLGRGHSRRADPGGCEDLLYRTGDLGYYDRVGAVHYVGRADNQVKVRGFRVELEDIESALGWDATVVRAVVVSTTDPSGNVKLVACVQPGEGYSALRLRERLGNVLPDYMVPAEFLELPDLPVTPNGKVDRAALTSLVKARPRGRELKEGPRDEIERGLVAIWQEVLDEPCIGINDDFFLDLGGHSLLATVLLCRIEEHFGRRLGMSTLMGASTIKGLAVALAREASPELVAIVPLQRKGCGRPAYWIPGGGGLSVLAFREISSLVEADRPVYGLEASVDLGCRPLSLPDRAKVYVDAIRGFQDRGPYTLMGFSAGSWLAYEMAMQLTEMRETVDSLVVFDTDVPGCLTAFGWGRLVCQVALFHMEKLRKLPWRAWRVYLSDTARQIYWGWLRKRNALKWDPRHTSKAAGDGQRADVYKIADNNSRHAVYAYAHARRSGKYAGTISVVIAEDAPSRAGAGAELDPRLGWRRLATGGISVFRVRGGHLSMLEQPCAESAAAVVSRILGCYAGRTREETLCEVQSVL
jgi:thioesterase domain-containing protein/acyl carrier protein